VINEEVRKRARIHVKFTEHARLAMRGDNIAVDDVISALAGKVIEKYPDDKPFPSCLVYGRTMDGRPLHVVCAMPKHVDMLIIVTVYIPTEKEWIEFRKRRRK
jgi:hypothetical protein